MSTRRSLFTLAVIGLVAFALAGSATAQVDSLDATEQAGVDAFVTDSLVAATTTYDELGIEWKIDPTYKVDCVLAESDPGVVGETICAKAGTSNEVGAATPLTGVMVYYSLKTFTSTEEAGVKSIVATSSGSAAATSAKGTATIDEDLTPATKYFIRVAASNDRYVTGVLFPASGSNALVAETAAAPKPDSVTGVMVTPLDKALQISWTAPHPGGADRSDVKIATYDLMYRTSETDTAVAGKWMPELPKKPISVPGAMTKYTLKDLTNDVEYDVQVKAVNTAGGKAVNYSRQTPDSSGTPSADAATTPDTPDTPDTPTGDDTAVAGTPAKVTINPVKEADKKATSVMVSWMAPGTGDAPLLGYQLEYKMGTASAMLMEFDASTTMATITGLTAATAYMIRVAGRNRIGVGTWSEYKTVTTKAATTTTTTTTGDPVKMAAPMVKAGDKMLMVSWTEPASEKSISFYHLDYKTASAAKWMEKAMNVTAMDETIDGLINDTVYLVRVRAVDSAGGMGDWSDNGSGTPMSDAVPTPALPLFGAFALGAGLLAAGRRRVRQRALRAAAQRQLTQ